MMAQETLQLNEQVGVLNTSKNLLPKANFAKFKTVLAPLLCFAIALVAALLNNLYGAEPKSTLIFDSRHYLESARLMVLWWQECLKHGDVVAALSSVTNSQNWFGEYLLLDGPVLPTMTAVVFFVIGKVPEPTDWRVIVSMFSVLHATSALLVCLLAKQWMGKTRWAVVAGLAWALYPAALIASGRFLTETPSALLLLSVVWLLSKIVFKGRWQSATPYLIGLGAVDGLLLLLKPALCPVWLFVHAIAWFKSNWQERAAMSLVCIGVAAVLLPWLLTTKLVTGEVQLLPQRVPAYNVAKGCDVEVDGWTANPSPPLTQIFSSEQSPMNAASGIWTTRPFESVNLIARKMTRMWSWPWNDFRHHPFSLSLDIQRWLHWLLCLAALAGGFLVLTSAKTKDRSMFIGLASVSIVAGHAIYLLFETINRYGFTAMPFVTLLATFAICTFARWGYRRVLKALALLVLPIVTCATLLNVDLVPHLMTWINDANTALAIQLFATWLCVVWLAITAAMLLSPMVPMSGRKTAVLLLAFACLISGLVLSAFAFNSKQALTWTCRLNPGESACRTIELSNSQLRAMARHSGRLQGALVLIDGDGSTKNATVMVNGHQLGNPVSIRQFRPERYWLLDTMRKYAGIIGFNLDHFRQWYAVSVPVADLNLSGGNVLVISADGTETVTIYGQYSRGGNAYPYDLDRFSSGNFCNDGVSLDPRVSQPLAKRLVASASSFETGGFGHYDDLSSAPGKQAGEYGIYLMTLLKPDAIGDDNPYGPSSEYALAAEKFDPLLRTPQEGPSAISISKAQFACAKSRTAEIVVPEHVLQGSHIQVTISGKMRSSGKAAVLSILPVAVSDAPRALVLPHTPAWLNASPEWKDFEIVDEMPLSSIPGKLKTIQLGIYPGPWEQVAEYGPLSNYGQAVIKDLTVKFKSNNRKTFAGKVQAVF